MIIIGTGGFAKQIIDAVASNPTIQDVKFYNDLPGASDRFLQQFDVLHSLAEVQHHFEKRDKRFTLGLSGPALREKFYNLFITAGAEPFSLIASSAQIGRFSTVIGKGCNILPNSIVESSVSIGNGVLMNVASIVTHDSIVGDFCEFGPGVIICGACSIGKRVFIGAGATILPGIKIGNDAIIGAGALVRKNVSDGEKVVGVPAKTCP